jgi:hypothetical protein
MPLRFQPPNPFPAALLPGLDGAQRPVAEAWARRPAVVLVGHRDCATTRLTLPFVDRLHRRRPDGTQVLAVLQDDPEAARDLVGALGLDLPVLLEADPYPLASALGLRSVPTVFVVGPDGAIRRALEGFRRDELDAIARDVGIDGSLFTAEDGGPARRPG